MLVKGAIGPFLSSGSTIQSFQCQWTKLNKLCYRYMNLLRTNDVIIIKQTKTHKILGKCWMLDIFWKRYDYMGLRTPWNKEWVIKTCPNEWAIVNIIWVFQTKTLHYIMWPNNILFQNNTRLPDIEHPG